MLRWVCHVLHVEMSCENRSSQSWSAETCSCSCRLGPSACPSGIVSHYSPYVHCLLCVRILLTNNRGFLNISPMHFTQPYCHGKLPKSLLVVSSVQIYCRHLKSDDELQHMYSTVSRWKEFLGDGSFHWMVFLMYIWGFRRWMSGLRSVSWHAVVSPQN